MPHFCDFTRSSGTFSLKSLCVSEWVSQWIERPWLNQSATSKQCGFLTISDRHFLLQTRQFIITKRAMPTIWGLRGLGVAKADRPFSLVHFVFPNTDHVMTLRRFDPLSCSLKRRNASMDILFLMNKGSNLLSIITWSVLGKQNIQAKKGLLHSLYFYLRNGTRLL